MPDIAVRVENLGKCYSLVPWKRRTGPLWALRHVSLDVECGQVVGIIGRNGAGKSTLLKVLSRITKPSEGRAEIHGRVGSILEAGTGFHRELTARENIYFNGAILGMKKREITDKLDEIIDFAGVEKFLETPLKYHSTGMIVRLAFSVAACLGSEILFLDEVLAAGDVSFQTKCRSKVKELTRGGRTVLFVSHNLGTIRTLCQRALLLHSGCTHFLGPADQTVNEYLKLMERSSAVPVEERTDRPGNGQVQIIDIGLWDRRGTRVSHALSGDGLDIVLKIRNLAGSLSQVRVALTVMDETGHAIAHLNNALTGDEIQLEEGETEVCCCVAGMPLRQGTYYLNAAVSCEGRFLDHVLSAARLMVVEGDFFGSGRVSAAGAPPLLMRHSWSTRTGVLGG